MHGYAMVTLSFCPIDPALFEYLNKGTILESKIFGIFTYHLGLHTG